MKTMWDERYNRDEYVYGTEPNGYFKFYIDSHKPGKILLPCEGEGRNAVYAAQKGYDVFAFDSSEIGKQKAMKLADQYNVKIQYEILEVEDFSSESYDNFDHIALIYAHLMPELRMEFHGKLIRSLNKGGTILMECFNKRQLDKDTGGPKVIEMLYDEDTLKSDFKALNIVELNEQVKDIKEGLFHSGPAEIIRMIAEKPS